MRFNLNLLFHCFCVVKIVRDYYNFVLNFLFKFSYLPCRLFILLNIWIFYWSLKHNWKSMQMSWPIMFRDRKKCTLLGQLVCEIVWICELTETRYKTRDATTGWSVGIKHTQRWNGIFMSLLCCRKFLPNLKPFFFLFYLFC